MLNYSDILRGLTDTIILSRLYEADSYGYQINKDISTLSNGSLELKEATLYTSFRRLEEGGYITSYWGDERAGARRRYYSITKSGRKFLEENRKDWESMKDLIDRLFD